MNPENRYVYSGLSNAAWGYFFLHFDFNLNNVSIFPRFVGWLLLLSACKKLSGERRDLALLRPLAVLMAVWHTLDWLLSWGGGDVDGHVLFLDLLLAVAGLYFHFQFLTDMAGLAEQYQPEDVGLDGKRPQKRQVYPLSGQFFARGQQQQPAHEPGENADVVQVEVKVEEKVAPGGVGQAAVDVPILRVQATRPLPAGGSAPPPVRR